MQMEDYFADAADRLKNGEAIESILARYPAEARGELQSLLFVVELAERVATVAPPRRVPVNRIAARVAFAQRAAELRAELEVAQRQPAATAAPPATTGAPVRTLQRLPVWARIRTSLGTWMSPGPLMRLAPLTVLLIVVYLLTFSVVAMAQESLPGDIVYPMKEWIREQRVATAPAEQQAEARWRADQELAQDVAKAAEALQAAPDAKPQIVVSILQFRGFEDDKLLAGDLKVIPWHQPENAGPDDWLPIAIEGSLEPGAVVMLRYQIVPGTTDTVQGIALRVMQAPPMPTPAPTLPPKLDPDARCQRTQPVGWVRYAVRAGETLSAIAARSDVTVSELRRFNCLTDGVLRAGTTIVVPASIMGAVPAEPPPVVVTAIATPVVVPTFTPVPTTPAEPTTTPSPPTSGPTVTETPGSPETTPAETPTSGADGEVTPVQTNEPATPAASETPATPVVTDVPTAETTATPGDATATPDATQTSTETPGATPSTTEPQATPGTTATATVAVDQPAATTEAAATATEPNAPAPTDAPAAPTSTPAEAPPTAVPSNGGSTGSSTGDTGSSVPSQPAAPTAPPAPPEPMPTPLPPPPTAAPPIDPPPASDVPTSVP